MVQVNNSAMINPTVGKAGYSQLTNAVIQGKNVELQASEQITKLPLMPKPHGWGL